MHLRRLFPALFLVICFLGCFPVQAYRGAGQPPTSAPDALQGYWHDPQDPDFLAGIEGSRLLIAFKGRVQGVSTILEATPEGLRVCAIGREKNLVLSREKDHLLFQDPWGQSRKLLRLDRKPAEVNLEVSIPAAMPLPQEKLQAIGREISRRGREEQTPTPGREHLDLILASRGTANTEYLRGLLAEVGWIDVARFDYGTSMAAFLLVQHTWDLPLMMSVLPRLKEDVDAGRMDGAAYALLFDRVQLMLGNRQRYGSQIYRNEAGEVIVLPLEDPEHVDARREALGRMIPATLKEYVKLLGGSEVKLSSECQR